MVLCVSLETLHYFQGNPIIEALRLRKRELIDRSDWANITIQPDHSDSGGFEYDEFDTPSTYYLVKKEDDKVIATGRINPTTRPYMLSHVFKNLCDVPIRIGQDYVEGSRIAIDQDHFTCKEGRRKVINEIMMAYLQCSIFMGAKYMLGFMHPKHFKSTFGNAGWAYSAIGKKHLLEHSGEELIAAEMPVTEDIRKDVAEKTGITGNILDFGNNPIPCYKGPPKLNRPKDMQFKQV